MKLSTIICATGAASLASAAHIQIAINPSTLVPSPSTQISHATSAYLTKPGQTYTAPLSTDGSFDFRNVSSGSYLVDIVSSEYLFAPLRLDILDTAAGEEVKAWGTWRGNEWSNNGEVFQVKSLGEQPGREGIKRVEISVAATKEVFIDRVGFSMATILKNPMMLMAGAAALMMFGMPYLIDNMDEETRAEFEERQKSGPMAQIMGTAPGKDGKPKEKLALEDFDAAGWLAGKTAKKGGKA